MDEQVPHATITNIAASQFLAGSLEHPLLVDVVLQSVKIFYVFSLVSSHVSFQQYEVAIHTSNAGLAPGSNFIFALWASRLIPVHRMHVLMNYIIFDTTLAYTTFVESIIFQALYAILFIFDVVQVGFVLPNVILIATLHQFYVAYFTRNAGRGL